MNKSGLVIYVKLECENEWLMRVMMVIARVKLYDERGGSQEGT